MTAGVTGNHVQGDLTLVPDSNAQDAMLLDHETRIAANEGALTGKQSTSTKGIANGYAGLDGTGKVPAAQLPTATSAVSVVPVANQAARLALSSATVGTAVLQADNGTIYVLNSLPPATNGNWLAVNAGVGVEVTANKDANNGYAGLDSAGKVTTAHLPDAALNSIHVTEYHPFDFRRYGARPDGTDCTSYLVTAMSDIQATTVQAMKYQNGSGGFQQGSAAPGGGEIHVAGGLFTIGALPNQIDAHRIRIAGEGWGSGFLRKTGTSGDWLTNRRDGTKHVSYVQLVNMTLHGNKNASSGAPTGTLVRFLGDVSNNFTDTKDEDYDIHCLLENCQILEGNGDAVRAEGSGACRIEGNSIKAFTGLGIYSFQDNYIIGNDVGHVGTQGIFAEGDSCTVDNNKCWYTGEVTPASGQGFLLKADVGVGAGNWAQDTAAEGVLFDGAYNWTFQINVDSASKSSNGGYAGVNIYNSQYINIQANVRNRYRGDGSFGNCKDALNHSNGSAWNFGEIVAGKGVWGVQNSVKAGSTAGTGTVLRVNGVPIT